MIAVLAAAAVAADSPPADVLSQILGYGVLGIVVVLLLTRMLVPGWVVSRQDSAHRDELDARETAHQREVAALQQTIAQQDGEIAALRTGLDTSFAFTRDQVVPALTRSTDALVRSNDLAREHLHELARRAGAP
jgi:hypothetical protein